MVCVTRLTHLLEYERTQVNFLFHRIVTQAVSLEVWSIGLQWAMRICLKVSERNKCESFLYVKEVNEDVHFYRLISLYMIQGYFPRNQYLSLGSSWKQSPRQRQVGLFGTTIPSLVSWCVGGEQRWQNLEKWILVPGWVLSFSGCTFGKPLFFSFFTFMKWI